MTNTERGCIIRVDIKKGQCPKGLNLTMINKEELAKLSRDEVRKLFYEKRKACRTCAQFGEMIFNDQEYILIKERLSEYLIEEKNKKNDKTRND